MIRIAYISLALTFILAGCKTDSSTTSAQFYKSEKGKIAFRLLDPKFTGLEYNNTVVETPKFNYFLWSSMYMGSGVGVGDFNNDGNADVYMGKNLGPDRLWFGNGDLTFTDVSNNLPSDNRWTQGVSVIDINNDGHLDIYINKFGPVKDPNGRTNQMLMNKGDGTFVDMAPNMGIADNGYSIQSAFADFDKDGDLDLYVVNQPPDGRFRIKMNISQKDSFDLYSDTYYEHVSPGVFVDKSKEYGIRNFAHGLNVLVNDINEDGWLDMYISNDYDKPDYIYINQKGKGFKDELPERTKHISNFAMGSDIADINNDNLNDIGVLDMSSNDHYRSKTNMSGMSEADFWQSVEDGNHYQYMYNTLQLNQGKGEYSEIGHMAGLSSTDWSWSLLFEDFDNDGYKDCYVSNGIMRDVRNNDFFEYIKKNVDSGNKKLDMMKVYEEIPSSPISNYMFQNNGDLTFSDVTKASGTYYPDFSHGVGAADFDNDGDVDLAVNVSGSNSMILTNESVTPHTYIKYDIAPDSRIEFLHGEIVLETSCGLQRKDFIPVRGYSSSMMDGIHFGVPSGCTVKKATLTSNYGNTYNLPVKTGESHVLSKSKLAPTKASEKASAKPFFASNRALQYRHFENEYNDFTNEVLLPHKLSEEGPSTAVGDIDGDNVPELIIGGSKGKSCVIFKKSSGKWQPQKSSWTQSEAVKKAETQAIAIYDADGDGDNDIYLGNGGNDLRGDEKIYSSDILLLNNGKGQFEEKTLPFMNTNTTSLNPIDVDGDGTKELVVFGGHEVGKYPYSDPSKLLKWEGTSVKDVSSSLSEGLGDIGSTKASSFVDFDGDGKQDIIAVGEWMAPTILLVKNGKLVKEENTVFSNKNSWWESATTGDFNGDGHTDIVLGAFGLNNKFHPSDKKPLEVFGNDFDKNGKQDIVLAKHYKGKVVPTRGRECSSQQIPGILDNFPTYEEFAVAGLDEILGEENIEKGVRKKANTMAHLIAYGDGKGGWRTANLPEATQISPVKSMAVADINKDGIDDIIGIGNHYGAEVETTRYDAGYGWAILGGKQLTYVSPQNAGIWFDGDGRSVEVIGNELLAFFNNGEARSYTF